MLHKDNAGTAIGICAVPHGIDSFKGTDSSIFAKLQNLKAYEGILLMYSSNDYWLVQKEATIGVMGVLKS